VRPGPGSGNAVPGGGPFPGAGCAAGPGRPPARANRPFPAGQAPPGLTLLGKNRIIRARTAHRGDALPVTERPARGPFSILPPAGAGWARVLLSPLLERLLGLPALNAFYLSLPAAERARDFPAVVLQNLGVRVEVDPADLARIPATGPLLVVANHPFGGLEGVALAWLLRQARPDVKLLANFLLAAIPEMRELIIGVDPFGAAQARNSSPLRQALRQLKAGGALAVFPAGEVSSLSLRRRCVSDPEWSPAVVRMARAANAPVLPVYFHGRNRALFQVLGLAHPRLRTALLPRELMNKRGSVLRVAVGEPLDPERLAEAGDDLAAVGRLRVRTYALAQRFARPGAPAAADQAPVAPPGDPQALRREIAALPPDRELAASGNLAVLLAQGRDIPLALREIGRQRELAFREAGEGSGQELDLDEFDPDYDHLVLWDRATGEVAGAYRLARVEETLAARGPAGLYTATLFSFAPEFFARVTPALELGRAFVRPELHKSHLPLALLWKGIGAYVARYPHLRYLFGPVSISAAYHPFSRALMMRFLAAHRPDPGLAAAVTPRTPPAASARPLGGLDPGRVSALCRGVQDLSGLVAAIEADGKGAPVLLRQYLKLGGAVLAFNLDKSFGRAIDGLVLVDLAHTPRRLLARHMGEAAASAYLAAHFSPSPLANPRPIG
jgi:putative hemolysin